MNDSSNQAAGRSVNYTAFQAPVSASLHYYGSSPMPYSMIVASGNWNQRQAGHQLQRPHPQQRHTSPTATAAPTATATPTATPTETPATPTPHPVTDVYLVQRTVRTFRCDSKWNDGWRGTLVVGNRPQELPEQRWGFDLTDQRVARRQVRTARSAGPGEIHGGRPRVSTSRLARPTPAQDSASTGSAAPSLLLPFPRTSVRRSASCLQRPHPACPGGLVSMVGGEVTHVASPPQAPNVAS